MRTVKELMSGRKKVYFYLPTDECKKEFAKMTGNEGYVTQSRRNAGILKPDTVMSIHEDDNTVYFCGMPGHMIMAAQSPSEFRVDFQKYLSGAEDYMYRKKE